MAHMMTGCFQHDADAVFARQIWWEAYQAAIGRPDVGFAEGTVAHDIADVASKEFIKRCESGFFNVKPTEKPIEA